jgi:tripartite-type tricarboxylate transporter receptor subunit TctC
MSSRLAAIALAAVAPLAAAQQAPYPSKAIRMIASQAPGGGIDTVCRIIAPKLSDAIGQPVIVDSRPGANGSVSAEITAKSPPDGYTIMLGAVGNLGINPIFYKQLGYDPARDLAPIASAVLSVNLMVVHPSVPANSVKEFIALVRKRPNQLAYGSSGTGGSGHLAGALFQSLTKTQMLHVPYKGAGPAIVDLVAGQVQLSYQSQAGIASFVKSGKLRALASTTSRRSKLFPQLPTVAEAGVPGYESNPWYGFVAAAKTPQPIITRLNQEITRVVNLPETEQLIMAQGLEIWTNTPDAFAAYIRNEVAKWAKVIKEAGITEM